MTLCGFTFNYTSQKISLIYTDFGLFRSTFHKFQIFIKILFYFFLNKTLNYIEFKPVNKKK